MSTEHGVAVLLSGLLSGVILLPSAAVPTVPEDPSPCLGCAQLPGMIVNEGDPSAAHDCPNSGCTLTLWSTVVGFSENCGGFGDCTLANCDFTWRMKYKTSGCEGDTAFVQNPTTPAGSPTRLSPSGVAQTIEAISPEGPRRACGNYTTRTGTIDATDPACGTLSIPYSFTVGCEECASN